MRCDEARPLLDAWLDGELEADRQRTLSEHAASCPQCRGRADALHEQRRALKAAAYERAPPDLAAALSARLAQEAEPAAAAVVPIATRRPAWRSLVRRAAVVLVACGATALATWHLAQRQGQQAGLMHEALTAHVRSLLQDSPVQIASSDRHTVKPWFTGRLDFAPTVKDLSAEGFPLVGGRLDYLGDRRVAVVVYKRRQHVINVFMWPHDDAERAGLVASVSAAPLAAKGYNGIRWSAGGIEHWAISDLNSAELNQLQKLF